jgi:hypothetical protein
MATGKNHSIRHTPGDVALYFDDINVSCDALEEVHKLWVNEQGVCTNQGPQAQLSMMLHSLHKEASALLCETVQGNVCVFFFSKINGIFCIFVKFNIFCILFIIVYFTARIDGDQVDDWDVTYHRTGERVPLRADRWYQKDPTSDPIMSSDIQINRHSNQHMGQRQGSTLHYTLSGWRWQSQHGLPCFEMGNDSEWQCWRVGQVCSAFCTS